MATTGERRPTASHVSQAAESSRPATAQRGDVQGLRAVAVLLVIASHAGLSTLRGGYVGVDVFFVLSGYLITGVMLREAARTGTVSILSFYARRARRILPAATVVLLATLAASVLVFTQDRLLRVLTDTAWSALFAANVRFATGDTGYFAVSSYVSPVRHFWSLAVEEQFYLLWPPLVVALLALARRRRRAETFLRPLTVAVAVLFVASLLWSIHATTASPTSAYFSTFTRGYELALGALLACGEGAVARVSGRLRAVAGWVGVAMIATAALVFTDTTPFPGLAALLPVAGTALALAAGSTHPRAGEPLRWGPRALLDRAPMRFVGDISYSLYLWHWPLLTLPVAYLGRPLGPRGVLAAIVLTFVAATLSYYLVENPVRRGRWFTRGPARGRLRALLLWPVAVSLVLGGIVGVHLSGATSTPRTAYSQPEVSFPLPAAARDRADPITASVAFSAALARRNYPLPDNLRPALPDLFEDVSRPPAGCFSFFETGPHRLCPTADTSSSRTVMVLGDSHGGMWLRPLTDLAAQHDMKLISFWKSACPPVLGVRVVRGGGEYPSCGDFNTWAAAKIAAAKPDLLIVASTASYQFFDPITDRPTASFLRSRQVFGTGFDAMLDSVSRSAGRTVVIGNPPFLPMDPSACLQSRRATMATCTRNVTPQVWNWDRVMRRQAEAHDATYVDPLPWFCSKGTCPLVVRNLIVYRDLDHVSTTYADYLQPALARAIPFEEAARG